MFLSASKIQGITRQYVTDDPFFNNVALLMHMDGANGGTSFPDLVGSVITTQGTPTTSTAQSKFGSASLSLNGSSALKVADKASIAPGTGDFTVEAWIRPTATAQARVWSYQAAGATQVLILGRDATGRVFGELRSSNGTNDTTVTGATVLTLNTWYHIAFVRQGTTCYVFVNGVMEGNLGGMSQDIPTGGQCAIGYSATGNNEFFSGFIDEVRFTKGVARYTSNFTPSELPFSANGGDASYASVTNLMHFEGVNGQTTTTDQKGVVVTLSAATLSTTQSKWGGSSLSVTGAAASYARFAVPAFGTGDFTIEFWVRFNAISSSSASPTTLWDARPTSTNGAYPTILVNTTTGWGYLVNGSTFINNSPQAITTNTWIHVALCRVNNVTTLYMNGLAAGNTVDNTNYVASTTNIGLNAFSTALNMNGFVDDVRVTPGVGRYTANFTPPASPYPNF